ncbi:MAG: immune inhibitor A [Bacteroidales bacterium]|nr:immune inhibitor A [Bacteroidales bacterium]
MKKSCLLIFALSISFASFSQVKYSKVKIYTENLEQIARLGIAVEEGEHKMGEYLITDLSENELACLEKAHIHYEIQLNDVASYYWERNKGKSFQIADYKNPGDYEVPENFEFGSMSGHATYDEITDNLDNMLNLFPNLITEKESIGQTIEGREMWMVKISDNPNLNEAEPEVFYNALTHAREPAGAMSLLFYMYYLLENYNTDPFIQTLVDNTEMYFVTVVNPDGYVYNQTTNPNGGGMWRKNRRDNGDGTYGVDLNRNYGYMWGYDNYGSSPNPGSETYRGTAPFSEPEIDNIRIFCESHEFKTSINYHTYGGRLLYPWDYDYITCPDNDILHAFGEVMIRDNQYNLSQGIYMYAMNGSADDWQYGEQTTKGKMFAYLPELGTNNDGFWCPIDRIIPIAQENMIQNIMLASFAGKYAEVNNLSGTIIPELNNYQVFDIKRYGLTEGLYTVSLIPVSPEIISVGEPKPFPNLELLEQQTDSIAFILDPEVANGTEIIIVLSLFNGDYYVNDTLTKIFGEPVNIFTDNCSNMDNWTSSQWGVTGSSYISPYGSITDSPGGNYSNNQTRTITLNDAIDLDETVYAVLNFWARWEIETGYDYVQLLISTDNGISWSPMQGKYTITGNENQASGEPVYDGFQTEWVKEEINLSDYLGNMILFRFVLNSDYSTVEDGYYFDDFIVTVVMPGTTGTVEPANVAKKIEFSDPIPNPAQNAVQFIFTSLNTVLNASFNIYNAIGQKVFERVLAEDQRTISINVSGWEPGIYYYMMEGTNICTEAKKLVVVH